MMGSGMCRKVYAALVAAAMVVQAPAAWAQLADIDPALHAAVEALVTSDPEVARDPELADLCRSIAEATIVDPRERSAVTGEVVALKREGVDISTVIPQDVRDTAREKFTQVQGEMREKLEALQATNPERAREMEMMMREGERQMAAFETGERYTPSAEMVAHAETMMKEWETDMTARGAPQEFVERARMEFAAWSGGEHYGMPGQEFTGRGGYVPSVEQMQAMGMTADQIQAAQQGHTAGQMPSAEQMQAMGMTADQIQAAQQAYEMSGGMGGQFAGPMEGHTGYMPTGWAQDQSGNVHYVGTEGSNYGINPSTGGWEPNMGGGATMGGWEVGYSGPLGFEGGSNYGINPATGGWEPGMGGTTTGGWETSYTGGTTETFYHEMGGTYGSTEIKTETQLNQTEQQQQFQQQQTQERTEYVNHVGHMVDADNNPGTPDVVHSHEIHIHTDATRHDHTTPGSGL